MAKDKRGPRVLAIDLRARRFGYAAFEGNTLLDYGAHAYSPGGDAGAVIAAKRVCTLIELLHPSAIIIKDDHGGYGCKPSGRNTALKSIKREALRRSIPFHRMARDEVKSAFRSSRARTKHEIASAIARAFPELLWKLPPKRRTWEPEREIMTVFDAVALGLAHNDHNGFRMPF